MKYIQYTILILAALFLQSCSDEVLEEESRSDIFGDQLYSEASGFNIGLNGLYSQMRREYSGRIYGSTNDLIKEMMMSGTDNMYSLYDAPINRIFNEWGNRNEPTESYYSNIFSWLYEIVNGANTIIERAENPEIDWAPGQKEQVLGQAKIFRAMAYRHLTYLWGPVPLTLQESTGSNIRADWERTSVDSIREQIIEDLKYAEENLTYNPDREGRFNKGFAQHYLAEIYLARENYESAASVAEKLIEEGPFSLVTERYGVESGQPGTPFTDMFIAGNVKRSEGNTEALWVVENEINVNGGDGLNLLRRWFVNRYYLIRDNGVQLLEFNEENGGRGIGRLAITKSALDLYGPKDDRGGIFSFRYFYTADNKSENYDIGDTIQMKYDRLEPDSDPYWPSTTKWDYFNPVDPTESQLYKDVAYVRLAETYLILAEAQFFLGNTQEAAEAINTLRRRAGSTEITAADVDLDLILDERSRELWSEEHRRYTLLRTDKWLERTKEGNTVAGPNIIERDTIFPIPQDVIDANLNKLFPQNPGY